MPWRWGNSVLTPTTFICLLFVAKALTRCRVVIVATLTNWRGPSFAIYFVRHSNSRSVMSETRIVIKKFVLNWKKVEKISGKFYHLDRKLVEQVKVLYWQTPTYITSIFRGFEIILVVKYHLYRSANIKYKMCTVYTTPIYIHSSPIWIIPWQNFIAKFHAKYYPSPPLPHTQIC